MQPARSLCAAKLLLYAVVDQNDWVSCLLVTLVATSKLATATTEGTGGGTTQAGLAQGKSRAGEGTCLKL